MTCTRPQRTTIRPGLEPGTPWSVVHDASHCASPPPKPLDLNKFCSVYELVPNFLCFGVLTRCFCTFVYMYQSYQVVLIIFSHLKCNSFSRIYNRQNELENELELGSAYVRTDRATAPWQARIVLPAGRIFHSKTDFLATRVKHFMIR